MKVSLSSLSYQLKAHGVSLSGPLSGIPVGGLTLITGPRKLSQALELCQKESKDESKTQAFGLWISDEGLLYPSALPSQFLPYWVLVQADSPLGLWRSTLDAVQTGIFNWILVRASQTCSVSYLRKLQLTAERMRSQIFVLSNHKLPHWVFKSRLDTRNTK